MYTGLNTVDKIALSLIGGTIIALYFVFSNVFYMESFPFWRTELFYAVIVMGVGVVLSILYRREETPSVIYILFFAISLITLIFSPLREFWLAGILGNPQFPIYGIMMYISTPMYIKAMYHMHKKNIYILPLLLSSFTIIRYALLYIWDAHLIYNKDFEVMSAYVLLLGILASVPLSVFKQQSKGFMIWIGLAVILNISTVIYFDNRTAFFALFVISTFVFIWIQLIKYIIKNPHIQNGLYVATPLSCMLVITGIIYFVKLFIPQTYYALYTLWARGAMIEQISSTLTWKDFFIGNGWGQVYTKVQDNVWVEGITLTQNNIVGGNSISQEIIDGLGFKHSHNNIFETLLSTGILGFIAYCAIWLYMAWCLRTRPVVLSILSGYLVLNAVWYHSSIDMIPIALMITAIIGNADSPLSIKPIYTKICESINSILAIVCIIFLAIIYIPYQQSLYSPKVPKEAFYTQWYNGSATGVGTEVYIWRHFMLSMKKVFEDNKTPSQASITKVVDILDTLKQKSNNGDIYATQELTNLYQAIFYAKIDTHPILEQIRKREYPNWATLMLRANAQFDNRPDLFIHYLAWHYDMDFYTAVQEVSKRLLAKNPNNAVALYWQAMSLEKQGKSQQADAIFQRAFKNNITRYHAVSDTNYKKYKHLLNPIYR